MALTYLSQIWLSNITYIRIGIGLVYPAELLDAYSRTVISHDASISLDVTVTFEAAKIAIARRQPTEGVIHRSDRDVQYGSGGYAGELFRICILNKHGAHGNLYEKAMMEGFFKTLKHEKVNLCQNETYPNVTIRLPCFLEEIYNEKRLHSALSTWLLAPDEFEEVLLNRENYEGDRPLCPSPTCPITWVHSKRPSIILKMERKVQMKPGAIVSVQKATIRTLEGEELSVTEQIPIPCFRCGVCCTCYIPPVSSQEIDRIALALGISRSKCLSKYVVEAPVKEGYLLKRTKKGCIFLAWDADGKARCIIHPWRPEACREWTASLGKPECREGLSRLRSKGQILLLEELFPSQEHQKELSRSLEEAHHRP